MQELIVNLHMHTPYSDGHGSHAEIAQAALKAGLDVVFVTDHNIYVNGPEGYYRDGEEQVLLMVGEEIHDQSRDPQKNHLLVFGTNHELATFADDPQKLIDRVKQVGGLSFIAHPFDPAAPAVGEPDISWVDWDVGGFSGIELWNGMSEFKSLLKSKLHALFYAYNPKRVAHGPHPKALKLWDRLLSGGERFVAVGGSDAHAFPVRLGPLRRTLFPYEFHFRAINTHILVAEPLSGDLANDRHLVLEALASGHVFIGYDLPGSTRGFRFTAHVKSGIVWMGDEISAKDGVTFQIRLPHAAECNLLRNGTVVKTWHKRDTCTYITSEPGVYRVEVHIHFLGRRRSWIYSNPIYVTS
jgi:hypothetical protein